MNYLVKLICVIGLCLTLISCGGGGSESGGNTSDTSVADTTPPIISILGDNPTSLVQGSTYSDAGAAATDDKDGTVSVSSSGSVDTSKIGSYTITYIAIDNAGNNSTKTRAVDVTSPPVLGPLDSTPPVIRIIGENPTSLVQGSTYSDAGATATDDKDGTVSVSSSGLVDTSKIGSYTITYTAIDSTGNTQTNIRTVNVIKNTTSNNACVNSTGDEESLSNLNELIHISETNIEFKNVLNHSINIDWYNPTNSNSIYYKLYRSCSLEGLYYQVGGDLSYSEYDDRNLIPDTDYFYKLKVCDFSGCSLSSRILNIKTASEIDENDSFETSKSIKLDKPYLFSLNDVGFRTDKDYFLVNIPSNGTLKVDIEKYTSPGGIRCSLFNASLTEVASGNSGSEQCISTSLSSGNYYIVIEGAYSDSIGLYSINLHHISQSNLPRPSDTQFNENHLIVQGNYVDIRWESMENIKYYEVYGSESENGPFAKLDPHFIPERPYYLGQKPSYIYYYKLKACYESGCSDFSVNTLKAEG